MAAGPNRHSSGGECCGQASAWFPIGVTMHTQRKLLLIAAIALVCAAATGLATQQQPPGNPTRMPAGDALCAGKAGCGGCHEVNGRGGITGPDLSAAGTRSPEALIEKIRNPNNAGAAGGRGGPSVTVAKMLDGREIRGVRRNEDTFTLQMVDASGQL